MKTLKLNTGREKSLLRRHPWIFSGAVKSVDTGTFSGDVVRVIASDGRFLAYAGYSEKSQIVGRVWSFDEHEKIDAEFFGRQIHSAVARRASLLTETNAMRLDDTDAMRLVNTNAMRLVHAESDGLPGLIVDRYGDIIVMQLLTAGIERWRDAIIATLISLPNVRTVYERSDADVRALEGLPIRNGLASGEPLPTSMVINENDLRLEVDIANGHKTGFYLDQRESRALTRRLADSHGNNAADVLNCFCYTGGMSVAALLGGAKNVLSMDSSGPALEHVQRNVALNGIDIAKSEIREADVFAGLRTLRDQGRSFDLIILDPPKFAPTAQHAEKAARAYKDINLLGFKLLRPNGILMTYSCSGGVSAELFQKIVAGAALDANVDAQIIGRLGPGIDHPVALNFPEGDYLKGLLVRRALPQDKRLL